MAGADAADASPRPDAAKRAPPPDEMRQVHEVTESSSDESRDEAGARDAEQKPEMPAPEVVEKMRAGAYIPEPEELYNTKNVADMHYLFTNDKLKEESPAIVLRSDPFCIPRVTDNVLNYRPMLNPLSIFLGEDKLLPGNFRLDPSETLPNAAAAKQDSKSVSRRALPAPPGSSSSTSGGGKQFRGKTSAFMGTMPRQTEFAEIPVSEKLFQNHEVFRPSPPIPRVPTSPSREQRSASSTGSRQFATSTSASDHVSTPSAAGAAPPAAPASLSDAMLLSSIQHTLDATTAALAATDSTVSFPDGTAESTSVSEGASTSSGYQIQPLQPLESVADTLTNYLPSRNLSAQDDSRTTDGQYYNAAAGYNPTGVPIDFDAGSRTVAGTFGSVLSPVESQTSTPYAGLFTDSSEAQPGNSSSNMQTFSSALGSISITTPTNGATHAQAGLITPQGGAARLSGETPRLPGAKKPRAKNVFRPCTTPGCTKGARGKSGLCQKHGGGKRCAAPNCPKGAQGSSNMCLFHGGGYRCTVEGCNTGARGTSGLCAKHGGYKKGKAGATAGKRGPSIDVSASKRIRTDEQPPAVVKAE
ncbi:unnamed protein product [Phytophthora lilii]|uniref:Unnamed protein product n=1 Tax=Phytophthora lilii TaxID=2077276 RepID=A0A9W6TGR2_9STRA|nr:unnamed protein product [Phytophthora lilii]